MTAEDLMHDKTALAAIDRMLDVVEILNLNDIRPCPEHIARNVVAIQDVLGLPPHPPRTALQAHGVLLDLQEHFLIQLDEEDSGEEVA